ncbi:hypothetical protein [Streptomyces asoensis]|uniref:hypothetical protein n=1 Tax=Streptomyces asoensis TaxID=249586 RepID=UPI0033E9D33C
MARRSAPYAAPAWAAPGNRWGPWFYWPMLCLSTALLVWRVVDGDRPVRVLIAAGLVALWAGLLVANRTARQSGSRT